MNGQDPPTSECFSWLKTAYSVKMEPLKRLIYARLCQKGEKCLSQCRPRLFYSQPRQLLHAQHPVVKPAPGIYAFHSIMSMHTCSNSSNISSNWHCINKLVCSRMVANVAGAYWLGTMKPSSIDVSSSSDSCFELGTYPASKLHDYVFSTAQFRVTNQAMWLSGTPDPHRFSYATFLSLGSGANASLKLWALFMLH